MENVYYEKLKLIREQGLWIHWTNAPWRLYKGLTSSVPLHLESSALGSGELSLQIYLHLFPGSFIVQQSQRELAITICSLTVMILY